jgi:nucleotide-binding universal stress UspA family protein
MYERVLLAYDGTFEGGVALREGAILARRCGAKVFLLSVVNDSGGVRVAESAYGGLISDLTERSRQVLEQGVARLSALGMVPIAKLMVGEPVRVIGAYAEEVKADLVVVGHHKRNLVERWWGSASTGAHLCDHIGCTVIIARNAVSDQAFETAMTEAATPKPLPEGEVERREAATG